MRLHPIGKFDNYPVAHEHIAVEPLAAAMGAEILGVAAERMTDAQFTEIRRALFRHKMIFFRTQRLTIANIEVLARRFGELAPLGQAHSFPGHPGVHAVVKEATDTSTMVFGSGWHTDSPFLQRPPAITLLYSVQVPPLGGDTMWANSALAYATLSEAYRRMIAGLKVHFSARLVVAAAHRDVVDSANPFFAVAATRDGRSLPDALVRTIEGYHHGLVKVHSVTGEQALYVDPTYGVGIEGMTPEESAPLLSFLTHHLVQPAFTCRLRWDAGMLAIWDNRLCVHQAYNDYQGHRREFHRSAVLES
jgi:alpha-ketoglutarate-dependent taurine dioxygenase